MRGSPSPHLAQGVFSNMKCICTIVVDTRNTRIVAGFGVHSRSSDYARFLELQFANKRCEAVRRRIPLYSGPQASRRSQPNRRKYLMRVPLAQHCAFANSRAQFCEYAMRGGRRRTPLYSGPQAPRWGQPFWRKYLMRVPLVQHCAFAESRVPICECAMDGGPSPHLALLASPNTK